MYKLQFLILAVAIMMTSCNRPKVVDQTESSTTEEKTNFKFDKLKEPIEMHGTEGAVTSVNQVVVIEQLPTSKYVYLRVKNLKTNQEYWIATALMDIEIGGIYFYKNGLLKTNFESKEYNRVFDQMYLVNNLVASNHASQQSGKQATTAKNNTEIGDVKLATGSVPIAELVKNPSSYAGKEVQVTGTCTKINPNIMQRNWVHLKDNSDTDYDFVLTTDQMIPEGHTVTMMGTLAVNKDFGAGYKYEIILENCRIIQ